MPTRFSPYGVAVALVAGPFVACREPMAPVGYSHSDGPPPTPTATPSASTSLSAWPHASAFAKWPRANGQRFKSEGHWFGRYDADLHVDGDAKGYRELGPGAKVAEGTTVVEVLVERGSGLDGPIFSMEKTKGGWVYVEVDVRRREVRRGRLEPCVTCHAQVADQDELFGVPPSAK